MKGGYPKLLGLRLEKSLGPVYVPDHCRDTVSCFQIRAVHASTQSYNVGKEVTAYWYPFVMPILLASLDHLQAQRMG